MERLCKTLQPHLDVSPTCVSWFRQASDHCSRLIVRSNDPGSRLWATVRSFIFPERSTDLVSQRIPISIHPNRLTSVDCQSLFMNIVHDYILRAPRYSAAMSMNLLLWKILFSLMGLMAMASVLMGTIFMYRKYAKSLGPEKTPLQQLYAPENRARAYINHNVSVIKHELKRLRVSHLVQPEELVAPDGTATLIMKMGSKLNFFDGIVSSNAVCTGRLYRMYEMMGKKKPEYKVEMLPKAMRFVNNYSRKMRVLFLFDEDPMYEETMQRRPVKSKSPPKQSPPKLSLPKINSQRISPPKLSPPKISPPKISPPKISPPRTSPPKISPPINPPRTSPPKISAPMNPLRTSPSKINSQRVSPPKISPPKINQPRTCSPKLSPPKLSPPRFRTMSPPSSPLALAIAAAAPSMLKYKSSSQIMGPRTSPPRSMSPVTTPNPQSPSASSQSPPTQIPRTFSRVNSSLNIKRNVKKDDSAGDI